MSHASKRIIHTINFETTIAKTAAYTILVINTGVSDDDDVNDVHAKTMN